MSKSGDNNIYFLENTNGQTVRTISWDSEKLNLVFRHDTRRVECVSQLKNLDENKIEYILLETVEKKSFLLKKRLPFRSLNNELTLVAESLEPQNDVSPIEDDSESFADILKKTAIGAIFSVAFIFTISFFVTPMSSPKEELEIVQVIDRKNLEVPVTVPPSIKKAEFVKPSQKVVQRPTPRISHKIKKLQFVKTPKKSIQISQIGALGILGSQKNSAQKGGLQINNAQVSRGIGRGGTQGSGGVQTAIYSKGLFAAPLGSGNRADGAGGYGTQGKGGGKAGYGKMSLVGSGNSFFDPIESETWSEGGLDRNAIAAVIYRHLSEVRFCYEQGLQQKPNLTGRVSMNFVISPTGHVSTANVGNSSLRHALVENCIRDHLKSWKFPQPHGGVNVKVSYPFVLRRVTDS